MARGPMLVSTLRVKTANGGLFFDVDCVEDLNSNYPIITEFGMISGLGFPLLTHQPSTVQYNSVTIMGDWSTITVQHNSRIVTVPIFGTLYPFIGLLFPNTSIKAVVNPQLFP
jgi:hypothetical protein